MGQPAPGRPGNPPAIEPSFQFWWTAWQDLSTTRQAGMTTISFFHIAQYADRFGTDLELLKQIVWGIDEKYLEHERKRIERERNSRKEARRG